LGAQEAAPQKNTGEWIELYIGSGENALLVGGKTLKPYNSLATDLNRPVQCVTWREAENKFCSTGSSVTVELANRQPFSGKAQSKLVDRGHLSVTSVFTSPLIKYGKGLLRKRKYGKRF
jgi:hypothetical protein